MFIVWVNSKVNCYSLNRIDSKKWWNWYTTFKRQYRTIWRSYGVLSIYYTFDLNENHAKIHTNTIENGRKSKGVDWKNSGMYFIVYKKLPMFDWINIFNLYNYWICLNGWSLPMMMEFCIEIFRVNVSFFRFFSLSLLSSILSFTFTINSWMKYMI